jgi:phage-related baseplate assembly protein
MVSSIATSPAVDLSGLPAPDIIDQPSFETRLAAKISNLVSLIPEFDALLESDPAIKVIEADSYDEMLLAQAFNDSARSLLLAYAAGGALDHLGSLMDVARLELVPANIETGDPAVMESDSDFRHRILIAPHSFSVAGPQLAYVYHAVSASSDVLDATATSPEPDDIKALVNSVLVDEGADPGLIATMAAALDSAKWPGDVDVSILSRTGDGTAPPETLAAVEAVLTDDEVRPLTDNVTVQSADILDFNVLADLYLYAGPDSALIMETAAAELDLYLAANRRLGRDITRAGIIAALKVAGVQNVILHEPAVDLVVTELQAGNAANITLINAGNAE